MSGQGNLMDFEVSGATDESMGAVIIAGIPIASDDPADDQILVYDGTANQWKWEKPVSSLFQATSLVDLNPPVASTDIALPDDGVIQGTDIVRASASTFTVQPGVYRLEFQYATASFAAAGSTEKITYQFYNATATASFGPIGEASGFDVNTTVIPGGSISTIAEFTVPSTISVRIGTVTGTTPILVNPLAFKIYKIIA